MKWRAYREKFAENEFPTPEKKSEIKEETELSLARFGLYSLTDPFLANGAEPYRTYCQSSNALDFQAWYPTLSLSA